MTEETRLVALLRSAVPPVVTAGPSRDLWPLVVKRSEERPKWPWFDVALAAGVGVAFLMRPDLLVLLAYHF